jgi:molecular chaperone GrpE
MSENAFIKMSNLSKIRKIQSFKRDYCKPYIMVENEKPQEKAEKIAEAPNVAPTGVSPDGQKEEMTDAESNEVMNKILNAFKEAASEIPVENKEAELQDKIARQQADFDNFRKRMEKEKQENLVNANANLISEILPVLDHFELALKHNKDKGVAMIYDELNEILKNNGLKIVDSIGIFNPRIHEAVVSVDGKENGLILEELQKGYLLNERLLRASKVKISRSKDNGK